ncbi:cytochrome c [Candidatus Accumulibacter sp. ACC003]|uniref:c-type cytochrome n=1 Tax=Candidatus Accumulibacter sp. ACC003 TaxID=2823334 RepID=UPI0025B99041|nr:cytochrome c [Candidatus Accumulibacter sp. ACC003]
MKASLLIALLAVVSASAHAGAGAAAQKAEVCAACHGADFNTPISADIPRLAGQYPDYLARALTDYKSGARKNALMNGQAEGLSAQDITELSAYIGALPSSLIVIPLHRFIR